MSDVIKDVAIGALVFGAGVVLWGVAKYAVVRFREYALTTETKADDELAEELENLVDKHKPGD